MSCPTCDYTMQCVVPDNPECGAVHLCPRCGTAKVEDEVYVPALVGRCREFEDGAPAWESAAAMREEWARLGIAEAINLPGDRP